MRDAFINTLYDVAKSNSNIVLITGDLGFGVLDKFAADLPNQFINAGVAEQSMMSMAAGLAASGKRVFVYSIANFPTLRCLEQIRNDVCAMDNSVVVVSVGAGYSYGSHGYSHHAIEDIGIIRALPNIDIHCPGDPEEAIAATIALCDSKKPAYLRLGKNGENNFSDSRSNIEYLKPRLITSGKDGCILFTGSIGSNVLEATLTLKRKGLFPSVYSVPNFSSVDNDFALKISSHGEILTVEENVLVGGFGMLIVEKLLTLNLLSKVRIATVGTSRLELNEIGSQDFLRDKNGLSALNLAEVFEKLF